MTGLHSGSINAAKFGRGIIFFFPSLLYQCGPTRGTCPLRKFALHSCWKYSAQGALCPSATESIWSAAFEVVLVWDLDLELSFFRARKIGLRSFAWRQPSTPLVRSLTFFSLSLLKRILVLRETAIYRLQYPASLAAWLSFMLPSVSVEITPPLDLGRSPMLFSAIFRVSHLKIFHDFPGSSSSLRISNLFETATAYYWA